MSITVSLGTNLSDERELSKTIDWTQEDIPCDVYNPVDRLNPVILLDKAQVNLINVNYMYIPEFGRYYFITNIVGAAGGRVEVHGHVDVLFTYDSSIRECPVIAARSSNNYNTYLHDNMRLFNTYVYNQYITLGEDLGEPDVLYMITLGKGGPPPEENENDNNNNNE